MFVHSSFISFFYRFQLPQKIFPSLQTGKQTQLSHSQLSFVSAAWDPKVAVTPNLVALWAVKLMKFPILEYFLYPCPILLQLSKLFPYPL